MSMAKTPFCAAEATLAAGVIAVNRPARTRTAIPSPVSNRTFPTIRRTASVGASASAVSGISRYRLNAPRPTIGAKSAIFPRTTHPYGAEESLPSPDEQERQDDAPAQDEGDRVRRHPGEAAQDDPRERRRLRIPEEAPDRHDSREAAEPEADATEVRRIRRDPDSGEDRRGGGMGADAAGDDRGDGEDEGGLDRPTGFLGALRPGLRERAGQEDEQACPQGDPDRDGLEIWGGEEP